VESEGFVPSLIPDPKFAHRDLPTAWLSVTGREGTLAFIQSTRGQDLSAYRLPHPFLGSLNIYDWFRTIAYHDLRHAKQIREVVETIHR